MFKRVDKDQTEIAQRLSKITKGQTYKDLNADLQAGWYRRAAQFIHILGSKELADLILDFIEGKDMV